jgi:hypothetical protein
MQAKEKEAAGGRLNYHVYLNHENSSESKPLNSYPTLIAATTHPHPGNHTTQTQKPNQPLPLILASKHFVNG